MIGRTNGGNGSGAGINLNIVGNVNQPAGKENTVWVKTDIPISSWTVSPNQPETPTTGMIWIANSGDNGINIIKKNAVEVCPSACKQYVNGGWNNMEAYLFYNGEWAQFSYARIYLIKDGKIVDGVTFTNLRKQYTEAATNVRNIEITETSSGVLFQNADGGGGSNASCKSPEYDFTNISKICYSDPATTIPSGGVIIIGLGNPTYWNELNPQTRVAAGTDLSLDVSGITGMQAITIGIFQPNTYARFTDLWLE